MLASPNAARDRKVLVKTLVSKDMERSSRRSMPNSV